MWSDGEWGGFWHFALDFPANADQAKLESQILEDWRSLLKTKLVGPFLDHVLNGGGKWKPVTVNEKIDDERLYVEAASLLNKGHRHLCAKDTVGFRGRANGTGVKVHSPEETVALLNAQPILAKPENWRDQYDRMRVGMRSTEHYDRFLGELERCDENEALDPDQKFDRSHVDHVQTRGGQFDACYKWWNGFFQGDEAKARQVFLRVAKRVWGADSF